jgi:hypothetical protein
MQDRNGIAIQLLPAAQAGGKLAEDLGEPYPPARMWRLASAGLVTAVRCGPCFRFGPEILQAIVDMGGITYSSRGGDVV